MVHSSIENAGFHTVFNSGRTAEPEIREQYHVVVAHLTNELYQWDDLDIMCPIRDPIYTLASYYTGVTDFGHRMCKRVPRLMEVSLERLIGKPTFRIEDQFPILSNWLGKVIKPSERTFSHGGGQYWVRQAVDERDMNIIRKILPIEWMSEWVERIPAYHQYDLWWMPC
jgi:hypothetical protein